MSITKGDRLGMEGKIKEPVLKNQNNRNWRAANAEGAVRAFQKKGKSYWKIGLKAGGGPIRTLLTWGKRSERWRKKGKEFTERRNMLGKEGTPWAKRKRRKKKGKDEGFGEWKLSSE